MGAKNTTKKAIVFFRIELKTKRCGFRFGGGESTFLIRSMETTHHHAFGITGFCCFVHFLVGSRSCCCLWCGRVFVVAECGSLWSLFFLLPTHHFCCLSFCSSSHPSLSFFNQPRWFATCPGMKCLITTHPTNTRWRGTDQSPKSQWWWWNAQLSMI